ncbi:MAG: hypothetical protein WCG67_07995 [Ferruginibacter sp.]
MQQLIASYLFQHKVCPLPGLGTLLVTSGHAETNFLNKSILAPQPAIVFETKETPTDALVDYIAFQSNINNYTAIETLGQFVNQLVTTIQSGQSVLLNGVGNFSITSSGMVVFEQVQLSEFFTPTVTAERVIHPDAEHIILVGDKETTNTQMTEYFSEVTVHKSRWWIWAILLFVIAITFLMVYFRGEGTLSRFGNAMPIK